MLTKAEKELLLKFLDQLSEHMGNAGCNDFDLPEDPELRKAILDYVNEDEQDDRNYAMDFEAVGYLKSKLKELL